MPTPEVGAALDITNLAVKTWKAQGWRERFLSLFKRRSVVMVLGCTGVGKTNLIRSLTALMPSVIERLDRTAFVSSSDMLIRDEFFSFLDTPGQRRHSNQRRKALAYLEGKKVACIINVVSYGYHEYRIADESLPLDSSCNVEASYLMNHRLREIEALKEWTYLLERATARPPILTAVSKADLWWSERERVLDYYRSGSYFEGLGAAKDLQRAVTGYSAVRQRFYGKGRVDQNFDQHDAVSLRGNLLTLLLSNLSGG